MNLFSGQRSPITQAVLPNHHFQMVGRMVKVYQMGYREAHFTEDELQRVINSTNDQNRREVLTRALLFMRGGR